MPHGDLPRASVSETIPMTMDIIEAGTIHFDAQADKRHLNPLDDVHGGFVATMLDSVTDCAMHSILEAGVGYDTVGPSVKMIKAMPVDTSLVAVGRVLYFSRTIGVSEGTLKTQDSTLLAYATAMCVIHRP